MQKMEKRLSVAVILLLHTCWLYQRPLYLLLGDDENCSASTVLNSHNVTSQITSFQMKITNIVSHEFRNWAQVISAAGLSAPGTESGWLQDSKCSFSPQSVQSKFSRLEWEVPHFRITEVMLVVMLVAASFCLQQPQQWFALNRAAGL